jgi:hypothetical protein
MLLVSKLEIQEPILRLLNLQLQRQCCGRLERFYVRGKLFSFIKTRYQEWDDEVGEAEVEQEIVERGASEDGVVLLDRRHDELGQIQQISFGRNLRAKL